MLYCFPELPFIMPKVTRILDSLKTSEYDVLCFHSSFSFDSLENAVTEHSQWLKFQNIFQDLCPQAPRTPKLYRALPTAVGK